MNLFAYRTTSLALKVLTAFSRARINLHDSEDLPAAGTIFVINHFTRLETLLLPNQISKLLDKPVWSLAADEFFSGLMGRYLDKLGAVSVKNPERDNLIIKSLLEERAAWIIFPEGLMVKNRKVVERGNFMIAGDDGWHPPHTGAAALALRAETLRQRWAALKESDPELVNDLLAGFDLSATAEISEGINIVPVNVTYYPLRPADKLLRGFSGLIEERVSKRVFEEVLVEGAMLLDGVDVDIRFGKAISLEPFVKGLFGQKIPRFIDDRRSRTAIKGLTDALMASIYNLTTVNLDHILASLLYKNQGTKFLEADLRQRAFLIATSARLEPIYFRHHTLKKSQVDLLLEGEGGRIAEFLEFAREKELLVNVDSRKLIFSDPENVCDGHAFHSIRVDNPFRVMANTVEPLKELQRLLSRLRWIPNWYLKKLTAKRLLRIMEQTYFDVREIFKGEAELFPPASGMPYLVKPLKAKAGIVLVHDWLQTPLSLRKLAVYLKARGFLVIVPRLPGHATTASDLENREFEEWQSAVDEAYAYATIVCSKVVVCGVGNSVALALSLATRGYNLQALVALFPALDGVSQPSSEPESANNEKNDSGYRNAPADSERQVKKMLIQAVKNLPSVTTPLLLLHNDAISKSEHQSLQKYFTKVTSSEKEFLLLPAANLNNLTRKDNHGGQALVDFIKRNLY